MIKIKLNHSCQFSNYQTTSANWLAFLHWVLKKTRSHKNADLLNELIAKRMSKHLNVQSVDLHTFIFMLGSTMIFANKIHGENLSLIIIQMTESFKH